eukprot:TRINITY_DN2480_c0_g1_i1.p1 TRINITY_DN2480_c0_g1~~TRINITY_DN2480_c0_g1_i1.p1  ORF type:complete len:250 (+),score=81.95 TRINITY_DN2480_c0_g1_i1:110-751(+)
MEGTMEEERRPLTVEAVKEMIEKKDAMEKELEELVSSLEGTPSHLIDKEGFPLAEVDIPNIRSRRHRAAILRTDLKVLMGEIEAGLIEVHLRAREEKEKEAGGDFVVPREGEGDEQREELEKKHGDRDPMVLVDAVVAGSASEKAGLVIGDEVLVFGSLSKENNPYGMSGIVEYFRSHLSKEIEIIVRRKGVIVKCMVTAVEGALGAKLIPIE